jgi:hypothetical protein
MKALFSSKHPVFILALSFYPFTTSRFLLIISNSIIPLNTFKIYMS